jgi:hypothetical protein
VSTASESSGERYRFEFRLPDVGLGEVWTALDRERDEAPVLVKLLGAGPPGDMGDPRSMPALVARLLRIEHPDVLPVRGYGRHEGRLYLVHDRFEGRSLASWLAGHRKARTRPGLATAQRLFDRVAEALSAVRERVGADAPPHGALSPRSVLLRRTSPGQYDLRVLDFGVAHLLVPPSGGHPGHAVYLAPEQVDDPTRESSRSDVFALAATLAEVLSPALAPPADGPGVWASLAREGTPKVRAKLASLRSDVPHAIWDLVALALQADAHQRPEHPGELRAMLQQQWKKLGLWEKAALTPEPDPPEAPPPPLPECERAGTRFKASTAAHAPAPPPPPFEPDPLPTLPLAGPLPVAAPLPITASPQAPSSWSVPPPRVQVTAWDHADDPVPFTLPIAPPSLAPQWSPPPQNPPLGSPNLLGLGASPLGAVPARAATMAPAPVAFAPLAMPTEVEAPTMLRRPLDAPAREPVGENTSLDLFIGGLSEERTGEDEPPFEDPSPTPPDGMRSIAEDDEGETGYRPDLAPRSPPPEPAPSQRPRSRLRARTIGVDEADSLSARVPPAPPAPTVAEPEGTRMIQIGWEAPSDDPAALVTQLASAPATPPSAWPTPLRASPAPDPFLAPVAPVVERTMAIDLSASGMAPPPSPPWSSPGLAPHGWTPPPSPASILAPPPVPAAPPARPVGWIIAGVVGVFAFLALLVVLVRA